MNSFKKIFFSFISLLVFGAVIILGVVLFPSPGFSHPVINWMPGRATETVAQGGNKTTVVSFVSRKDLTNVSVWVVPELQPYISANPSYFSSINAGDLNIITLNISAPLTPPLETESLDGTIHLRNNAGNKTYSSPLPLTLTITGWQKFTEPEAHYSVAFPPAYTKEFVANENLLIVKQPDAEESEEAPYLSFLIDPNPDGLTVEEYYDGEPGQDLIGQSEEMIPLITANGTTFFKFDPITTFAGGAVTIFPRNGEFLRITDEGGSFQDNGLLDSILNTLEF